MKVLLINGSPKERGTTYTALNEAAQQLNKNGVDTKIVWIGQSVPGCIACQACKGTGRCMVYDDIVNEVLDIADEYDGFLFGAPVYYGSIAGGMKCFMDRLFYTGHDFRYKVGGSLCALRRSGGIATFQQLNNYLNLAQMVLVPTRYWMAVHGNSGEELKEDKEGLQVIREMANNMTWLMQSLEKANLPKPEPEQPRVGTNFIRKM